MPAPKGTDYISLHVFPSLPFNIQTPPTTAPAFTILRRQYTNTPIEIRRRRCKSHTSEKYYRAVLASDCCSAACRVSSIRGPRPGGCAVDVQQLASARYTIRRIGWQYQRGSLTLLLINYINKMYILTTGRCRYGSLGWVAANLLSGSRRGLKSRRPTASVPAGLANCTSMN
jgi:hypothetical protein